MERDRVVSPQSKFDSNDGSKERRDCGARKAASVGVGVEHNDKFVRSGSGDDVGGYALFNFFDTRSRRSTIVDGEHGSQRKNGGGSRKRASAENCRERVRVHPGLC